MVSQGLSLPGSFQKESLYFIELFLLEMNSDVKGAGLCSSTHCPHGHCPHRPGRALLDLELDALGPRCCRLALGQSPACVGKLLPTISHFVTSTTPMLRAGPLGPVGRTRVPTEGF